MISRFVVQRVTSGVGIAALVGVLGGTGCIFMPKKQGRADAGATPSSDTVLRSDTQTGKPPGAATVGVAIVSGAAVQAGAEAASEAGTATSGSEGDAQGSAVPPHAQPSPSTTETATQVPVPGASGGLGSTSAVVPAPAREVVPPVRGQPPTAADPPPGASSEPKENDIRDDANAVVKLHPDFAEVGPGSAVSLKVEISGAVDVRSVPFYLIFDPNVVKIVGAREGPFLKGDGNPTAFLYALNASGDRMVVGHSRLGPVPGITGDGLLCTINLLAVGRGDARLGVEQAFVVRSNGAKEQSSFDVGSLVVR